METYKKIFRKKKGGGGSEVDENDYIPATKAQTQSAVNTTTCVMFDYLKSQYNSLKTQNFIKNYGSLFPQIPLLQSYMNGSNTSLLAGDYGPQINAYLLTIKWAEGTLNVKGHMPGGYNVTRDYLYKITDLSKHPNESKQTNASGAYQFIGTTWRAMRNRTGTTDFSPISQDINAIELLKYRKALTSLNKGDFYDVVKKMSYEFASWPNPSNGLTRYPPNNKAKASYIGLRKKFIEFGGKVV